MFNVFCLLVKKGDKKPDQENKIKIKDNEGENKYLIILNDIIDSKSHFYVRSITFINFLKRFIPFS